MSSNYNNIGTSLDYTSILGNPKSQVKENDYKI